MAIEPAPSEQHAPRRSIIRRVIFWIAVAWFCCFHILLVALLAIDSDTSGDYGLWLLLFIVAGGLFWLASAYWIYDKLFRMVQARWPEAKSLSAILSPLFRSFLFPLH